MARIFRSQQYLGNRTFLDFDPAVSVLRDHIFNPDPTLGCPGIYDYGRKLVHQSIYSRGPEPIVIFPPIQPNFFYTDIKKWAEDESYIFLGLLHDHYGHFLLSTLSRLWSIQDLPKYKILCYSPNYLVEWSKPYVRDILSALDLDPARFVSFDAPVKIREIILPFASFEEQNFVHRTFARMCNAIGDRLTNGFAPAPDSTLPVYLSKERITRGVRKIINEAEICEHLEKSGFEILFPEEMTFSKQVAMWRSPRPVVAFSSSGLHTSIFSPKSKVVSLSHDPRIVSSFVLCDWANDTKADYFHFEPGAFEDLGPSPVMEADRGISSELKAIDPHGVADAVLRALDASLTCKTPSAAEVKEGRNLSLGRPTRQSSSAYEHEAAGSSATSGLLTGLYQFHTLYENAPWWEVDLGSECEIKRIIVYNRTDVGSERAAKLRVMTSRDGNHFDIELERQIEEPFGGLNGEALYVNLERPRRGRYVRLSIMGENYFHLDQVEVFGWWS